MACRFDSQVVIHSSRACVRAEAIWEDTAHEAGGPPPFGANCASPTLRERGVGTITRAGNVGYMQVCVF